MDYFNARYYNPSQGQFISQDPIFQALGSPSAEQMAQQQLQDILSNPQQLNAYSYSLDNPITRKDPSGKLTTQAALTALAGGLTTLSGLLTQLSSLLAASTAAGKYGIPGISGPTPISSALFNRSLTLNPGSLTINQSNQEQYGDVVNTISNNGSFQQYLANEVNQNSGGGNSVDITNAPYEFKKGDLHTALDQVNVNISGTQAANGAWNLNVSVQKNYTFDWHGLEKFEQEPAVTVMNDLGDIEEGQGISSQYNIGINFPYTYTP